MAHVERAGRAVRESGERRAESDSKKNSAHWKILSVFAYIICV
jgi:hypothetical protein